MELITIRQAAEMLDLKPRTIISYLEKGILTKFRGPDGSNAVRLSADEVKNFFRPSPPLTSSISKDSKDK